LFFSFVPFLSEFPRSDADAVRLVALFAFTGPGYSKPCDVRVPACAAWPRVPSVLRVACFVLC